MKLFHYVHCPFCIRVRMGLNYLQLTCESIVIPYDDEVTPLQLSGKKMLPILINNQSTAINESLEILRFLDSDNRFNWEVLTANQNMIESLLEEIGANVHSLCMPYWMWTPEFNDQSRRYFQLKKESKRGPFKHLINNKSFYIERIDQILIHKVEPLLKPYFMSDKLTILDIMLASHLWGMYIFPEYQFSPVLHLYLQKIKIECSFDYHCDFWL